ncbi:MAG: Phosphatidyl-N-methylethanolamine N-methyltransferase [Vezdaea acicularis]|nr:MAG: Phosphatidyl-N-methylethanolamine N-methyltransferase [Vezdaea acicularis]
MSQLLVGLDTIGRSLRENINFNQKSLLISAASIAFNPLFWKYVVRRSLGSKCANALTALSPVKVRTLHLNTPEKGAKTVNPISTPHRIPPQDPNQTIRRQLPLRMLCTRHNNLLYRNLPRLPVRPPPKPPSPASQHNHSSPLARYERALRDQPSHPLLETQLAKLTSYSLLLFGNTLVLSSMWALGFTGTYLGDYFGILMDAPVTSFPFNITGAPMYFGSTLSFLGSAVLYGKPAGLLLTAEVYVVYLLALRFEE